MNLLVEYIYTIISTLLTKQYTVHQTFNNINVYRLRSNIYEQCTENTMVQICPTTTTIWTVHSKNSIYKALTWAGDLLLSSAICRTGFEENKDDLTPSCPRELYA